MDRSDTYKLSFKPRCKALHDEELDSMENAKIQPVDTAAIRKRREQFVSQNRVQQSMLQRLIHGSE